MEEKNAYVFDHLSVNAESD